MKITSKIYYLQSHKLKENTHHHHHHHLRKKKFPSIKIRRNRLKGGRSYWTSLRCNRISLIQCLKEKNRAKYRTFLHIKKTTLQ